MAITFHCEHCGKKIEASNSAAGKWGKCPACRNKVYVPNLESDEELKLTPIDEREEEKKRQLMAETYKITQDILLEREDANGSAETGVSASELTRKELTKNIILWLRQMADGELAQAKGTVELIIPYSSAAIEIVDRIALSEIPEPELADIRPQVLSGLIRSLRTKIT